MKLQNGKLELFSHVNTYLSLLYILQITPSKSCWKVDPWNSSPPTPVEPGGDKIWPRAVIHVWSKFSSPSPLWKVTHCPDWIHLTWKSNFRIFLLLGCHGQESNTSRFSMPKYEQSRGDPSCRLCGAALEDPTHFISSCSMLEANRREPLPPNRPQLRDMNR